jgi:hypothetical protein
MIPSLIYSRIAICIPIALESRIAIAESLFSKYGTDYLFLGRVFQDRINNEFCQIVICDRQRWQDDNGDLVSIFKSEQDRISNKTLQQIDSCQQIIYLISDKVGYDACLRIAKFTQVILSIGGIVVKVDSAGIVREKNNWLTKYNSDDVFDIYSLFVTLVEGENYYYSCGMNNFGKADVSLDITKDIGLAIYVMKVFNYYRLTDTVILKDGQTFQPDFECPMYQMQWQEWDEYETSDPRSNFYGRWHLSCIDNLDITYQVS